MADGQLVSHRQRIEQDDFFARMEDYGFFDTVSEHLPEEFTAVYEIARIIENEEHPLGAQLAPVLAMSSGEGTDTEPTKDVMPNIVPAEEYEADLLRNIHELPHIYPHQFLLPENVFFQKLVERSLWLPRPRPPHNFRFQSQSDTFKPDHRKQKVYVLFDVSRSMNLRWRIHLAKAIAFIFLRRNMKELGTVYLRTFAESVNDLQSAQDVPSFNELIGEVMHLKAVGKGTVLQKAIQTAIDDIKSSHTLSDAEILVITDGAAHIELQKLRDALGQTIKVHTVKIGDEKIVADAKFVEFHLRDTNTEDALRLKSLLDRRHDVEVQAGTASSGQLKSKLTQELGGLNKQISVLTERVAKYISEHYGNEIIELSNVYVNVHDIHPDQFLQLTDERRRELELTTQALLEALHNERLTDDIKKAAVLYDHLELLLKHDHGAENDTLRKQKKELEDILQRIVSTDGDDDVDDIHLSSFDTKQLRNMLEASVEKKSIPLARVLRMIVRKIKNWLLQRREIRRARIVLQRKLKRY